MALFKILRGNSSNLFDENGNISSTVPFNDGYCYFTPDNKKFYIDWLDKSNIQHRDPLNSLLADKLLSVYTDSDGNTVYSSAKLVGGTSSINDSNEEVPTSAVLYAKFDEIQKIIDRLDVQSKSYLTFSSPNSFTLAVNDSTKHWDGTLEYFASDKTWTVWDGTTTISSVDNDGEYVLYLRGTGNTIITGGSNYKWVLTGSDISCIGNIENLLDYAIVKSGNHPPMASNCYYYMFKSCTNLTKAPDLPATTLASNCYFSMFDGCTSLTKAPTLPATILADYCYMSMFSGCTSLTQAPALSAITLATGCYSYMFYGCTGLTQAPVLPATTLARSCYLYMFSDCTSLTQAPALPATKLADYCYADMFDDCTSLTKAPTLPATTLASDCYSNMFRGCINLTQAPSLPAATLTNHCYSYMFYGCTNLKLSNTQTGEYTITYRIPSSGTGSTADSSLDGMFTSTGGTFTGTPEINTTYYLSSDNMVVRDTEVATLRGYVGSMIDRITPSMQTKITGNADDFVVIGSDGNVTTKTILNAEELSF